MATGWTGLALAVLLAAGSAAAQAPGERFTPAAAPIVALPRLTPAAPPPPGTPPLTPGVVWEHPPEAPAALSPVTPPGPPAGRTAAPVKTPAKTPAMTAPPAAAAKPPEPTSPPPPSPPPSPPTVTAASPAPTAPPPPPPPAVKPQPLETAPAQEAPKAAAKETTKEPAKVPPARRTVVATAGLYLRATPDGNGRVLDTVEKGERVEAFGAPVDGWQRVGRQGRPLGYVSTGHLATAPDAEPSASPPAATSAPKPGRYAKADREDRGCALPDDLPERVQRPRLPAGSVVRLRAASNLRVAPVCDAKVLDVLEEGERVTVLEAAGSWYRVGRGGRALGYVGAALLTPAKR
ncbi:SH3 domain-containing protein [Azospirillum sp. TSO35-2]|uniref:SH3 domain-containing protein n=1 Tax=Azospirillum sp. TSO35-2 TaxID=716796 RepID=UPI000D60A60A|nr:SH3 domain-containing protein [Azospirillum sp. TSO35-2]PWC32581.1 hypothetical protein TSO352_18145 [Azospirillum sp. TSO35-2]